MFPCFRSRVLFTSTVLLAVLLGLIVFEKEGMAQTSLSLKTLKKAQKSNYLENISGGLTVTAVSDFKEADAHNKQTYSQYELGLAYKVDELNKVSLYVPFQKDLSQDYKEEFFLDAKVSHVLTNFWDRNGANLSHTTSLVYPTTEGSKVRDEMYSGIELTPRVALSFLPGLSLIYMPRYRRRFHKFTTNRAGDYLVNESLLQFFVANYSFNDKWAIQSTLVYVQSRRYDGARTDDSYLTVQELQLALSKTISLASGIQTGGSLLSPERGESKTIEIFDENTSEIYASASVSF